MVSLRRITGSRVIRGKCTEQRCGGTHVRRLFVAMRSHTLDFGFEQGNALCQFVLRICVKQLGRQLVGCVAFGARTIIEFHGDRNVSPRGLAVNRDVS